MAASIIEINNEISALMGLSRVDLNDYQYKYAELDFNSYILWLE